MRRYFSFLIALFLIFMIASSYADPLMLADDLTDTIVCLYDENDPSAGSCSYHYCFPHISEEEPDAGRINPFYDDRIAMLETNVEFLASGYADGGNSAVIDESYRITCNNDEYFSVLIIRNSTIGDHVSTVWQAHTFSRISGVADTSYDLPRMLDLLDADELDEYQLNRQTEKAGEIVRSLIIGQMRDNPDHIPWFEEFTEDDLIGVFYPEEDFYLNENGDPVFFIEPGIVADDSFGYIVFTIPLEMISDEL